MILGSSEIKKRLGKIINDALEENVQQAGIDIRAAKFYKLKSGAFLGKTARTTPEVEEIFGERIVMRPGDYVIVETIESVDMPKNICARALPRSTLQRCGVFLRTAMIDPGYKGVLAFGMKNESDKEFEVEKGARIAQVVFEEVNGNETEYSGKYQGGKIV